MLGTALSETPTLAALGFEIVGSHAYEGASNSPRLDDVADYGPDEAVYSGIETLRARSRHHARNNPWAQNAVSMWVAAAVGTGLRPRWRHKDKQIRLEFQDTWDDWITEADYNESLDLYGLQALVMRTVVNAGEAFVRKRIRPLSARLSVPLQVQVLEPDMLADELNEELPSGGYIKGGIQYSKSGKKKYYWFYKHHPGEFYGFEESRLVRVPAQDILHVYRMDRVGQTRGIPWVSSALLRLRELDQYEDAELVRKKTAALFAAFITESAGNNGAPVLGGSKTDKKGRRVKSLNPGTMQYLSAGQEVKFSSPADVGTTYEPWLRYQLLSIAKAYGITYEMLTGDLRNVNYSSIRAGLLDFRRLCEQVQQNMLIHQLCRGIGRWFMDIGVAAGVFQLSDYQTNWRAYNRIAWQPARWEEVDPLKKYLADKGDVRSGFAPLADKVAQRGYDIEEAFELIAQANELADQYGLRLDSDPRYTDNSGTEQSSVMEALANNED